MRCDCKQAHAVALTFLRHLGCGKQLDFDPAWLAAIEQLISIDRRGEWLQVRENGRRIKDVGTNHVYELGNIFAVRAIPHAHGEILVHGRANWKCVRCLRIDTYNAERPCLGQGFYGPLQDLRGTFARLPIAAVGFLFRSDFANLLLEFFFLLAVASGAFGGASGVDADGIDSE
jgi:hypothetical protein